MPAVPTVRPDQCWPRHEVAERAISVLTKKARAMVFSVVIFQIADQVSELQRCSVISTVPRQPARNGLIGTVQLRLVTLKTCDMQADFLSRVGTRVEEFGEDSRPSSLRCGKVEPFDESFPDFFGIFEVVNVDTNMNIGHTRINMEVCRQSAAFTIAFEFRSRTGVSRWGLVVSSDYSEGTDHSGCGTDATLAVAVVRSIRFLNGTVFPGVVVKLR